MAWQPGDFVTSRLAEFGAPPTTLDAIIKDGDWNWFFRTWAADQDTTVQAGSNFLSELWNNMDMSYLDNMYVQPGATMRFESLPPELAERVHNMAEGMSWDDTEDQLRTDAYQFTYGVVDPYTATFVDDVQALQGASESVSQLSRPGLTRDRIDRAVVDGYNDQVLKAMEKGDWTTYEQSGDIVFVQPADFDSFAPGYRGWITTQDDYIAGNLQMAHKGRALDPGEIVVTGCRDTAGFKTAIRAVTKKKVTFQ